MLTTGVVPICNMSVIGVLSRGVAYNYVYYRRADSGVVHIYVRTWC